MAQITKDRPLAKFSRDNTKYGKRHKPGQWNKTEEAYAEILHVRHRLGEIVAWEFEPITLRLADGSRYTPDFLVMHNDGTLELVNVKGAGPIDPNSLTKHKVAAELYWMFRWTIERRLAKGAGWERTEY